ncbi:ABC transporter permease [Microbacterium sp. KRD172]|uniref:ABC transporter permease n=1 Tax=Microbacterium sp. KRD172 TaxID=2729727 RepID=UPI0019CFBF54|nr:ABC transporter permease [Microbacterium sp. KRD172]
MTNDTNSTPTLETTPIIATRGDRWKEMATRQETLLIAVYVIMVLAFSLINPRYFSTASFGNILQDFAPVMLMAIGQTFVIITGGIDLSVGAVLGLSGVSAALAIRTTTESGMSPALSITIGIVAALLVGATVGVVNGLLITRVKLAPFIATLATMGICMGTTLVVTGGVQVAGAPKEVVLLGNTRYLEVFTVPLFVVLGVLIIAWLALSRTRFGRHTYAIGSNQFAARVAGINVDRHLMKVYVIGGVLAAIAGLFVYFRLGSGSPASGRGGELQAIAAAVIGGISLMGGVGRVTGTALGALITASVLSGLILIGIEPNAQQIVVGALIALAVAVQGLSRANSRT